MGLQALKPVSFLLILLSVVPAWAGDSLKATLKKHYDKGYEQAMVEILNTDRFIAEEVEPYVMKAGLNIPVDGEHALIDMALYLRALVEIEKERLRRGW